MGNEAMILKKMTTFVIATVMAKDLAIAVVTVAGEVTTTTMSVASVTTAVTEIAIAVAIVVAATEGVEHFSNEQCRRLFVICMQPCWHFPRHNSPRGNCVYNRCTGCD